jgi:predicted transcriptional regulator
LIAWDDRPEVRHVDIKDIAEILDYFFDMISEEIWSDHADLFAIEPAFDDGRSGLLFISARVLGRQMKKIAAQNKQLYARIKNIIEQNAIDPGSSKIAEILALYFSKTAEEALQIIKEIQEGFA